MTMASVMAAAPTPWMMRYVINIGSEDARTHPMPAMTEDDAAKCHDRLAAPSIETGPNISGAMPKLII